jgi:succinate dehydrogenase / fumarate reductase, iron-sulfur subunit
MAKNKLATVKLFRFDPEVDIEPRYQEYRVPYQGHTVLSLLRYIYENIDSTFAYRWACNKGFCRACVLSVNDRPVMACMEPANPYMKIAPHPKFKVIRDLIVDFNEKLD